MPDIASLDWFNILFIVSFDSAVRPKAFDYPQKMPFGVAVCAPFDFVIVRLILIG
jgi:hypothetical protein